MGIDTSRTVGKTTRTCLDSVGQVLATPLRVDLLVDDMVVVECKATTKYTDVFEAQTLTYLKILNLKLGLVINFGGRLVSDGVHRVVNGL